MKKLALLLFLGFSAVRAMAGSPIDNPGGFPEYYCGNLFPERFIGAPASASGNKAALEACANRYAMAEAAKVYGTDVKFRDVRPYTGDDEPTVVAYIVYIVTANGKSHPFFTRIQVDSTKRAPDGYPALIVGLTPLGVCEGTNIDACG